MKKILLLMAIVLPIIFTGCSKDGDDDKPISVLVNVTDNSGDIASPSLVRLYQYENAKDFDKDATSKMGDQQKLVDKAGNEILPAYTSDSFSGINIFENVKEGRYLIIVFYKPSGYSFPMFYYYGYKDIEVNQSTNAGLYKINFSGKERGKFTEF